MVGWWSKNKKNTTKSRIDNLIIFHRFVSAEVPLPLLSLCFAAKTVSHTCVDAQKCKMLLFYGIFLVIISIRSRKLFSSKDNSVSSFNHETLDKISEYELHDLSNFFHQHERFLEQESSKKETMVLELEVFDEIISIELKHHELVRAEQHEYMNGKSFESVRTEPILQCFYRGQMKRIEGKERIGAFHLCLDKQISGSMYGETVEEYFSIEPISVNGDTLHLIYKHGDILSSDEEEVRKEDGNFNNNHLPLNLRNRNLLRRELNFIEAKDKHVSLLLVNDYLFYEKYQKNTQIVALDIISRASAFYANIPSTSKYTIDITVAMMITFVMEDPYEPSIIDSSVSPAVVPSNSLHGYVGLLESFQNWLHTYYTFIQKEYHLAHLLTGYNLALLSSQDTSYNIRNAGHANIGTLCSGYLSSSVAEAPSLMITIESSSVASAHEIAHVLGADHDEQSSPLTGTQCAPSSNAVGILHGTGKQSLENLKEFTLCTLEWFEYFFTGNHPRFNYLSNPCADLPAVSPVNPAFSTCGNGIVEENEECDCPGNDCGELQNGHCCDGLTCRLKSTEYECGPNDGCCASTCKIAPAGEICREAQDSCDIQDTCDGISKACTDVRSLIGTACVAPKSKLEGTCGCYECIEPKESQCSLFGVHQKSGNLINIPCGKFALTGDQVCNEKVQCKAVDSNCYSWTLGGNYALPFTPCDVDKVCNENRECVPTTSPTICEINTNSPSAKPTPAPTQHPTNQLKGEFTIDTTSSKTNQMFTNIGFLETNPCQNFNAPSRTTYYNLHKYQISSNRASIHFHPKTNACNNTAIMMAILPKFNPQSICESGQDFFFQSRLSWGSSVRGFSTVIGWPSSLMNQFVNIVVIQHWTKIYSPADCTYDLQIKSEHSSENIHDEHEIIGEFHLAASDSSMKQRYYLKTLKDFHVCDYRTAKQSSGGSLSYDMFEFTPTFSKYDVEIYDIRCDTETALQIVIVDFFDPTNICTNGFFWGTRMPSQNSNLKQNDIDVPVGSKLKVIVTQTLWTAFSHVPNCKYMLKITPSI